MRSTKWLDVDIDTPVYKKVLVIMITSIILASGCSMFSVTNDESTPVSKAILPTIGLAIPTETAIQPTSTFAPTSHGSELVSPTTSPLAESTIETWQEYANLDYGFRFRYSSSWTLVERPNMISLVYRGTGITLGIRFKRSGDTVELLQYGGAAGDFTSRGTVSFLGEEIEKMALVFQGVDKEIHYNETREINQGELVFTLAIKSNRNYDLAVIPEEIQMAADKVLTNFELIE